MSLPLAETSSPAAGLIAALPLLIVAGAYVKRTRTLAARGTPPPAWRGLLFAAGLGVFAVAILSPLERLAEELVFAHMLQHLLILDVAALLLILGLTGPLLQPVLAVRSLRWLRALAHPAVALPLWIANLYLWHVPGLYEAATFDSSALHALEHACFFATGSLMWMALLGPLPRPAWFGKSAALISIGVVRLAGAAMGNAFMFSGSVFYDRYAAGEAEHGISALSDQGTAGVIMMAESTVVVLGTMVWLFFRWAAEDSERQRLLDLADERGVELDPARAARAASAGEGARLEERLRNDR